MVFRPTLLVATLLLMLATAAISFYVIWVTPEDRKTYEMLTQGGQIPNSDYTAKQERSGVVKTLLLTQGGLRKKALLTSRSSELLYAKAAGQGELMEELYDVELLYQDQLLPNEQQIVVSLQADRAHYFYQQQKLVADKVLLKRYLIPGHTLPSTINSKPFFSGTAAQVDLNLNEVPTFAAHELKGAFTETVQDIPR